MKRSGTSKSSGKQYTYYCCEHNTATKAQPATCEFRTWDVPVKEDCPQCGHTMFKKSGKGYKRPYCINEACPNFLPEEKRGYVKKAADAKKDGEKDAKKTVKKTAAKKSTTKKTTTKKTTEKAEKE